MEKWKSRFSSIARDTDPGMRTPDRDRRNGLYLVKAESRSFLEGRDVSGMNPACGGRGGECGQAASRMTRLVFSEEDRWELRRERFEHPHPRVQLRMDVLWLIGCGESYSSAARLIYDRALDSDIQRERLREREIDLVCPHRKNRARAKKQDGRALRRFARRSKIERTRSRFKTRLATWTGPQLPEECPPFRGF
jgi:hypothetical protein